MYYINFLKYKINPNFFTKDLNEIDSTTFMTPFLEVIKSEETSGPVTGMALTSVSKFISYGLVGINNETSAHCVQQIADSITHARFVGTDSSSDEVVLMKILHVCGIFSYFILIYFIKSHKQNTKLKIKGLANFDA